MLRAVITKIGQRNSALLLTLACISHFAAHAQQPTFDWVNKLSGTNGGGGTLGGPVAADLEGNVFATWVNRDTDSSGQLSNTAMLVKLSPQGKSLWNQTLPVQINALATDTNGAVYVTGRATVNVFGEPTLTIAFTDAGIPTTGNGGAYVAKFDGGGSLQWVRLDGGNSTASGNAITVDNAGNYYVAGLYSGGAAQFGATPAAAAADQAFNMFVAKYDPTGQLQWIQVGQGSDFSVEFSSAGIAADQAGNVFVEGYGSLAFGNASTLSDQGFLLRFDSGGNLLWARQFAEPSGGLVQALDGGDNYLAVSEGPFQVSKFSAAGDHLWNATWTGSLSGYGGPAAASNMQGDFFVAGTLGAENGSLSSSNLRLRTSARNDVFVVKYSSVGAPRWALSSVGLNPVGNGTASRISDTRLTGFVLSPAGGCVVSGSFKGTVQFGATTLVGFPNDGGQDAFVAHIVDPDTLPPSLAIARAPGGISVSWPASATGFVLEATDSLASLANWIPETTTPVVNGDQNTVTLQPSHSARFYRLRGP